MTTDSEEEHLPLTLKALIYIYPALIRETLESAEKGIQFTTSTFKSRRDAWQSLQRANEIIHNHQQLHTETGSYFLKSMIILSLKI